MGIEKITGEAELYSYAIFVKNRTYKDLSELLFIPEDRKDLLLHDTYKNINNIAYFLELKLIPAYKNTKWETNWKKFAVCDIMQEMAELLYKLLNRQNEILNNEKYTKSSIKLVDTVYKLTENFVDFIMVPNGNIIKCFDRSHDVTIAEWIVKTNNEEMIREVLPDNYIIGNLIVLDRSITDKLGILRFHVNPDKDGYIWANRNTIGIDGLTHSQKRKLRKNHLYREACGGLLDE